MINTEIINELFTYIPIGIGMALTAGTITWGISAVCRIVINIIMEGVKR
ncbi:MAG: hypothetical protein FWD38_09200 [Oscillospiraceae bacterium]|nr:hypothetical protein [Oscillospiraceae bacterium]